MWPGRSLLAAAPVILVVGAFLSARPLRAQTQAQAPAPTPEEMPTTRPCTANPILGPATPKKSSQKKKETVPPDPLPTCIEVKGEGLEVQEFLQNGAREETWRIGENRTSEDMWSFVRYFNPDELEKYCETKVLLEPVKFTSGKAAVTIRTTDLPDSYSRVQISARFMGEGGSADKNWPQPTSEWKLNSKGVLEGEIVIALQKRFKSMQ